MTLSKLEIHYDPNGEWAALYVNGELDCVGDRYLAEGRAFELAGVSVAQDDAFLRGQQQQQRDGVAQTLDEGSVYRAQRDDAAARAAQLREEAARLLAQADEISKGGTR